MRLNKDTIRAHFGKTITVRTRRQIKVMNIEHGTPQAYKRFGLGPGAILRITVLETTPTAKFLIFKVPGCEDYLAAPLDKLDLDLLEAQ